jgi:hypothetical protein
MVVGLTLRLVLLTAVAAALGLVGSATAGTSASQARAPGGVIVPQRGMGGVTLGMSQSRVRSTLGSPLKARRASNEFGRYTVYRYKGLSVTFQGNLKVTAVSTQSRRQRTLSGVGVGSTESAVRAGVRGVHCRTESGFRHCLLGVQRPGRRVTDFSLEKGLVVRVVVGFVID